MKMIIFPYDIAGENALGNYSNYVEVWLVLELGGTVKGVDKSAML